jgi:ankyrin repeat protein
MDEKLCHTLISESCLGALHHLSSNELDRDRASLNIYKYSARFWIDHIRKGIKDTRWIQRTANFLSDSRALLQWIQTYEPHSPWYERNTARLRPHPSHGLYYASLAGLVEVARELIDGRKQDVNAQGDYLENTLQAALFGYVNPFQATSASIRDHDETVELLLNKGADVNAQGGPFGNALQIASASFGDHKEPVELLLRWGADVNAQGGHFGNALQAASYSNRQEVVELLLSRGANVNSQGGYYGSALQAASYSSRQEIVELLLSRGANVNAQGGHYGNALQAASFSDRKEIVELLLNKGADVNAHGGYYVNALHAASYRGRPEIVELLLNNGADISALGGPYGNIYNIAAFEGHTDLLDLLLAKSTGSCDPRDNQGRTPLHLAARGGHIVVVERLLEHGLDVNAKDSRGDQVISYAASGASVAIVCRILDHPSLCIEKSERWSPLHWACRTGGPEVLSLLAKKGYRSHVVRTLEPPALWTPYSIAVFHGNQNLISDPGIAWNETVVPELAESFSASISNSVAKKVSGISCDGCEHVSILYLYSNTRTN